MQFSSSEFTLLPQSTNDKHLWTMAAICWVFQSILSWNWLALYEKCTENCHAYQGKSSHNSAFFFFFLYTCSYEYFLVDSLRYTQEYTYWTACHAIYSDLTDSLQTKTQNKMQLCTAPEL